MNGQGERLGLAAALAGLILLTAAFVVGLSAPEAAAQIDIEIAPPVLLAAR
jgi:hypothetical protein